MKTETRQRIDLDRFAARVLIRTRSGTGVTVYRHRNGTWGFTALMDDTAVTRTSARSASFRLQCRACGVETAICTTDWGVRVKTPCLCSPTDGQPIDESDLDHIFDNPDTSLDSFAAEVFVLVTQHAPFTLYGMVRGYLASYWPSMGPNPSPKIWASLFLCQPGESRSRLRDGSV